MGAGLGGVVAIVPVERQIRIRRKSREPKRSSRDEAGLHDLGNCSQAAVDHLCHVSWTLRHQISIRRLKTVDVVVGATRPGPVDQHLRSGTACRVSKNCKRRPAHGVVRREQHFMASLLEHDHIPAFCNISTDRRVSRRVHQRHAALGNHRDGGPGLTRLFQQSGDLRRHIAAIGVAVADEQNAPVPRRCPGHARTGLGNPNAVRPIRRCLQRVAGGDQHRDDCPGHQKPAQGRAKQSSAHVSLRRRRSAERG
ncbi:MAG: hypothetical protein AAFU49_03840 [Pseudomonadota bacterium]